MPKYGGHVGFVQFNEDGSYWSENRAVEFLEQIFDSPLSANLLTRTSRNQNSPQSHEDTKKSG
jgi:predicted alpha/beta-fold hydrolase